jgi:hypothetical protein
MHQWLVHEPEPLVSGLAGRRVSAGLVDRFPAMIAELRAMEDAAGGGDVLPERDRQMYLTLHVEALTRPGTQHDLDAAADKGIEAIQRAENLSSYRKC